MTNNKDRIFFSIPEYQVWKPILLKVLYKDLPTNNTLSSLSFAHLLSGFSILLVMH